MMTLAATRSLTNKSLLSPLTSKILYVVRHGQATHNPRAEAAREKGCSFNEFFDLMMQDDSLDSELTDFGRKQAENITCFAGKSDGIDKNNPLKIDLVVGSCLSRTMETADLIFPPRIRKENTEGSNNNTDRIRRISLEEFREINGKLLNAKRRTKSELIKKFPHWNFDALTAEEDESWTHDELEKYEDAAERGYCGLVKLLSSSSSIHHDRCIHEQDLPCDEVETILLVCHGGILYHLMNT